MLFDKLFAGLFFAMIGWWLFPIIAFLVKLDSKGPVFFQQERWGVNNKPIICYKFRTMHSKNAYNHLSEEDFEQTSRNDPRVTRLGKVLRKYSIDELPQFLKVLTGDISVVGPRPHMLNHTKEYNEITENFMVRHFVKPGITGLAQIRGLRGEITDMKYIQDRINMDIEYLENWNIISDIKICFLTIYHVFKGDEHAY
jgi:lipopolysaccharide/colanic/teichoic acid biosynthesis glycosyltransferase